VNVGVGVGVSEGVSFGCGCGCGCVCGCRCGLGVVWCGCGVLASTLSESTYSHPQVRCAGVIWEAVVWVLSGVGRYTNCRTDLFMYACVYVHVHIHICKYLYIYIYTCVIMYRCIRI